MADERWVEGSGTPNAKEGGGGALLALSGALGALRSAADDHPYEDHIRFVLYLLFTRLHCII